MGVRPKQILRCAHWAASTWEWAQFLEVCLLRVWAGCPACTSCKPGARLDAWAQPRRTGRVCRPRKKATHRSRGRKGQGENRCVCYVQVVTGHWVGLWSSSHTFSLFQCRTSDPSRPTESEPAFWQGPRRFLRTVRLEKHWCHAFQLLVRTLSVTRI